MQKTLKNSPLPLPNVKIHFITFKTMCSLLDLPMGSLSSIMAHAGSDAAMACWDVCTTLQGAVQESPANLWNSIEITNPRADKSSEFVRRMRPRTLVVSGRTPIDLQEFFSKIGDMSFLKEITVRITHCLFGEDPFADVADHLVDLETLRVFVPRGIVGTLELAIFGKTHTEIRAPSAYVDFVPGTYPHPYPPTMTLVCQGTNLFTVGAIETLFETLHVNTHCLIDDTGYTVLPDLRIRDLILNVFSDDIIVGDEFPWPSEMRSLTVCVSPYTSLLLPWKGIENIERVRVMSDDISTFYLELAGGRQAPSTWVADHLEVGSGGQLTLT